MKQLLLLLIIFFYSILNFSQTSDSLNRRTGILNSNSIHTTFTNTGIIGELNPSGSWKYDSNSYFSDMSILIGVQLPIKDYNNDSSPDTIHSVFRFAVDSTEVITNIKDQNVVDSYNLSQNYPNPFNPSTIISYQIPKAGLVNLKVYDILGREVVELVNKVQSSGNYQVEFNASNLPNGVYIYRLQTGSFTSTKKLILLK